MRLSAVEGEMEAGSQGPGVARAISSQVAVGRFFDAPRFVEITHAHVTVDYEVMGDAGLAYLAALVGEGARVAVPTTRNSSSVCPPLAQRFRQDPRLIDGEAKTTELLVALGVAATNSCVPYEIAYTPGRGERIAWGDTGAVAYANGALGARTNFEGGAASLWAALTGRTPEFGFQLDAARRATAVVKVDAMLTTTTDWAVLGALAGERLRGYDHVPLFDVGDAQPSADALKGLAAAVASYGSIAMFHVLGITPEASSVGEATGGRSTPTLAIDEADLAAFYARSSLLDATPELVVFTAPQLSAEELQTLADLVGDRRFDPDVTVIVTTSPRTGERLAGTAVARLRRAGAVVVEGTCWYLMDIARMQSKFGWRTVVTPSPKLANIVLGSGYLPIVRPMRDCVDVAVTGRLSR
jgi:predicted aconitase